MGLSLLLAGGLAAACSRSPSAPLPPPSSSPEQVAQVYLRAAKAQDCDLTGALTLAHTWNWCDDPRLLDYRSMNSADLLPASQAGHDQECVGFYMNTHASGPGWQHEGWQPWSLCLVKTNAGWRLYDQGQGLSVYDYDQGERPPVSTSPAPYNPTPQAARVPEGA